MVIGIKSILRPDILASQLKYSRGISSTYKPDPRGLISIPNASGGLLAHVVNLALEYGEGKRWLLVSEPLWSDSILANFLNVNHGVTITASVLESEIGTNWNSMHPEIDLCDPFLNLSQLPLADVIITQALLEHVVDPVQVIRALSQILRPGGILVVQTCNPFITLHRYPIDTLRFFPVFLWHITKYVSVTPQIVEEIHGSVYAVLKKSELVTFYYLYKLIISLHVGSSGESILYSRLKG